MAYADDTNVVGVDYAVPTPATDRPFVPCNGPTSSGDGMTDQQTTATQRAQCIKLSPLANMVAGS